MVGQVFLLTLLLSIGFALGFAKALTYFKIQKQKIQRLESEMETLIKVQYQMKVEIAQDVFRLCSRAALLRDRIVSRQPDMELTVQYATFLEERGKLILERLKKESQVKHSSPVSSILDGETSLSLSLKKQKSERS